MVVVPFLEFLDTLLSLFVCFSFSCSSLLTLLPPPSFVPAYFFAALLSLSFVPAYFLDVLLSLFVCFGFSCSFLLTMLPSSFAHFHLFKHCDGQYRRSTSLHFGSIQSHSCKSKCKLARSIKRKHYQLCPKSGTCSFLLSKIL